eukprot:4236683-Pleurochrysis_carterae.AAC.4
MAVMMAAGEMSVAVAAEEEAAVAAAVATNAWCQLCERVEFAARQHVQIVHEGACVPQASQTQARVSKAVRLRGCVCACSFACAERLRIKIVGSRALGSQAHAYAYLIQFAQKRVIDTSK